ncbi:MAG: GGDEF domain-containing protein [Treponema sp.]|jgi:diguanylate cyclase (GGDEF)-like protein|nr:GGDEF domain-containing protein [Treponema sp.]
MMMHKLLHNWRYYGFEEEQYHENMEKVFNNNLRGLCRLNMIAAIFMACFSIYPMMFEHKILKACIYLFAAAVALALFIFSTYKFKQLKQEKYIDKQIIYLLMIIFYADIMLFGIYVGVWSNPDGVAVTFMSLLICALFMFITSPLFNFCLNSSAFLVFSVSTIIFKKFELWVPDVENASLAFMLSLIFGWQIAKMRIRFVHESNELENERDSLYNLSTIDELTQLKNRRDFTQTFQRFLGNYRQADNFLCIALMDIDFFKKYNDHYGHSKGDDCLRSVGKMLNELQNSDGIYAARVGGEEFAMLWFQEDAASVNKVTALVSRNMCKLNIPHDKSKVAPFVTLSIGVHVVKCGASYDMHALYDQADKALYAAKKKGRNSAVISGSRESI